MVAKRREDHLRTTGKALSVADAIKDVVRVNPELYLSYREDSYAGREA
jgi:hypothetical protein